MTIMVGKATKFASQPGVTEAQALAPDVSTALIVRPPVPERYQALRTGPDFTLEYEPNVTPSIDGSASFLRSLSPFMIQVEPPAVYSSEAALLNKEERKQNPAGIYEAGKRGGLNPWSAARSRLQTAVGGIDTAGLGKSVEAYVAAGAPKPTASGSTTAEGSPVTQLDGNGPGRIGTPAIADVYVAVDIAMQLKAILSTPPLILLINPASLQMAYSKMQQYTDRTRFGYVFQAWGEEQPKLSISARCGAFYSGGRGVQFASRRDSASWQNLMTAFHFYKNNGYVHDTVGKSNAHHFVGVLSIHYDQWVYYGNMESFSYTLEDANQLGGVTFEMEFTVSAMVDTSKAGSVVLPMKSPIPSASDPRYYGQQAKAFNRPGTLSVGLDGDVHREQSFVDIAEGGSAPPPLLRVVGGTSATTGTRGFQKAAPATKVTPLAQAKPAPFRVGR